MRAADEPPQASTSPSGADLARQDISAVRATILGRGHPGNTMTVPRSLPGRHHDVLRPGEYSRLLPLR
jgi:hypothetical protein